jgi:hypothetical protein
MCLGGMEIVNNDRTATYAANGWAPPRAEVRGCYSCGPNFAAAMGEPNGQYSNPGTDKAPWFSTTEPESIDFGGLLVTRVEGLGPGQYTRSTTPRASGRGSFVGPGVQASPVIVVRGILMGRTCCSVDYGMRWLSNVLRGSCGADCDGDDLTFLDCCPEICPECPEFEGYPACIEPYLRTLKGVSLLQSPTITARYGTSCGECSGCALVEVEFRLSAAQPCVFREPVLVQEGVTFVGAEESDCPEWVPVASPEDCVSQECQDTPDCVTDFCPPTPKPPKPPSALNPCVCDPMTTVTACINMPGNVIPDFAEGVPIIEIFSGSTEMRQIRIRFQVNPLLLPADQLDPCDTCGEVTLAGLPPFSTFRMDGTTGKVTVTCPGSAETDATPLLGSTGGRLPFRMPEIQCGGVAYTACIETEAESVSDSATVSLSVAVREC